MFNALFVKFNDMENVTVFHRFELFDMRYQIPKGQPFKNVTFQKLHFSKVVLFKITIYQFLVECFTKFIAKMYLITI